MTENIFNETATKPEDNKVEEQQQETPVNTVFDQLVGEGKKFKDNEALAQAKQESDTFIERLKQENQELREKLTEVNNSEQNLDELRREINTLKEQLANKSSEPSHDTNGALTAEDVEKIVSSSMTRAEESRTRQQNLTSANDAMVRHHGTADKAREAMEDKANELGMTVKELTAIAARSPSAFAKMVLPAVKETRQSTVTKSDVNTSSDNFAQTYGGPKNGTKAYFDNKRKEMGNAAFFGDIKLQQEIINAKASGTYDE